jgi:uncharacterized protein (DUF2336 family)
VNLATSSASLLSLARSRRPADRERLLLAIVDLCDAPETDAVARSQSVQTLLSSIFMELVVEAERDIRRRLAEKLSTAAWAPSALINVLALDDIEIAAPIIAGSPVLNDLDLVRLLVEATIEHQIAVARRPELAPSVVSAILEQAEPAVLTALAGNQTAHLSEADMAELTDAAQTIASLRAPLSEHPRLTSRLAERLYLWVGLSLRKGLSDRFNLDEPALDDMLAAALVRAQMGVDPQAAPRTQRDGEREAMEQRLVEKLHTAGQLRPGYLIRALREQRLGVFSAALAELGEFDIEHVRSTLNSDRPELLALACAAIGIDRSVFPDILRMVRDLNAGKPGGGEESSRRACEAFAPVSAGMAASAFRQAAGAV